MGGKPTKPDPAVITSLPNQHGWIATEFREYNVAKTAVINTYKTLDRLGKGGFGTVYKVQHTTTNNIFAMKYISDNLDAAIKEAEFMKTLSHRSIAKVHKYFKLWDLSSQKPLGLCIIMDYVQGDTLREVLRRLHSPFPKIFVMEWFIRILEAIAYIHALKIFHRDIKPDNIIVNIKESGEFEIVLVDFGLAAQLIASFQLITVAGTYAYISPDMFSSDGKVPLNGKADMWALGCVLYEIWTKDSSFTNSKLGMLQNFTDPLFFDRLGDPAIVLLLSKMLEVDPAKRVEANDLLNSDAIKAWKTAIEPSENRPVPKGVLYVLPYISILKDPQASFVQALSNLVTMSKWLNYHQALVDQCVAPALINLLNIHTNEKSVNLLLAVCKLALGTLLSGSSSNIVVYQIVTTPFGIETLFKMNAFDVISMMCGVDFGHTALVKLGLDHYIRKNFADREENAKGAVNIFEELPSSPVRMKLYLDQLNKVYTDQGKNVAHLSFMLKNHKDINECSKDPETHRQLSTLLGNAINSHFSEALLGGVS